MRHARGEIASLCSRHSRHPDPAPPRVGFSVVVRRATPCAPTVLRLASRIGLSAFSCQSPTWMSSPPQISGVEAVRIMAVILGLWRVSPQSAYHPAKLFSADMDERNRARDRCRFPGIAVGAHALEADLLHQPAHVILAQRELC